MRSLSAGLIGVVFCVAAGWSILSPVREKPFLPATPSRAPILLFTGTSDASAAVAVGTDAILVADDETNVLRLYAAAGGAPKMQHDLSSYLAVAVKHPEADIEAAAHVGNRVYWITSHGRNKNGKWRETRHRLFATDLQRSTSGVSIGEIGRPFAGLAQSLITSPQLRPLGLDVLVADSIGAVDVKSRSLAPKASGLNIEGLCATPSGSRLYLGLRNPVVRVAADEAARALVIPLDNPAAMIEEGAAPRFGTPLLWNLGGMGIRSMVYSTAHDAYFIIAGPTGDEGDFALYRWAGTSSQPEHLQSLDSTGIGWTPEALVAFDGNPDLLVLSDDGSRLVQVGTGECLTDEFRNTRECEQKHLREMAQRTFRGWWIPDLN